jgi:hypothetical protein
LAGTSVEPVIDMVEGMNSISDESVGSGVQWWDEAQAYGLICCSIYAEASVLVRFVCNLLEVVAIPSPAKNNLPPSDISADVGHVYSLQLSVSHWPAGYSNSCTALSTETYVCSYIQLQHQHNQHLSGRSPDFTSLGTFRHLLTAENSPDPSPELETCISPIDMSSPMTQSEHHQTYINATDTNKVTEDTVWPSEDHSMPTPTTVADEPCLILHRRQSFNIVKALEEPSPRPSPH